MTAPRFPEIEIDLSGEQWEICNDAVRQMKSDGISSRIRSEFIADVIPAAAVSHQCFLKAVREWVGERPPGIPYSQRRPLQVERPSLPRYRDCSTWDPDDV